MSTSIDPSRIFTRQQVDDLLTAAINKTLLEVDKAKLFAHHEGRDKVKGIAGDIIEESVLGCKKDSKQEPDILVDGVLTELKTTGMIEPWVYYWYKSPVVMQVMQTSTTYSQHSPQEIPLLCTNRNHCFLCVLSFVSSSHRQPNALKSRTHYITKDYTHVRDLHFFSSLRASAPS